MTNCARIDKKCQRVSIQKQANIANKESMNNQSGNNAGPPASSNEGPPATTPGRGAYAGGRGQGGRNNRNRGQRGGARNYGRAKGVASSFKGETAGMNGNVFQTQEESRDPTQYKRTMEALERFANKQYDVDMRSLFDAECVLPTVTRPVRPEGVNVDPLDVEEYREEVKQYVKDKKSLEKSLRAMFSVIWGQCSLNVVSKLLSLANLGMWKENGSCHELIKAIQQIMMKYDHQKCPYVTLLRQLKFFFTYRQRESQDLHTYFEVFQIMKENIDRYGGEFGNQPAYVRALMEADGLDYDGVHILETVEIYEKKAREKFLATTFLLGGRLDTYGDMITDLENDYLKGHDYFPSSMSEAYHLMANYGVRKNLGASRPSLKQGNGIGFLQTKKNSTSTANGKTAVPGTDGTVHTDIQCWRCKEYGHYSNKCPIALLQDGVPTDRDNNLYDNYVDAERNDDSNDVMGALGFGFLNVSYSLFQSGKRYEGLQDNWILLDTQSNCDIFKNSKLLKNLRKQEGKGLVLHSNGGQMYTDHVGEVPGYGTVWYNPDSLANILSFANVRRKFNISMKTGPGDPRPTISVYRKNGGPMEFVEHSLGLYVHEATANLTVKDNDNLKLDYDYLFLNTTVDLESQFTKRELKQANLAKSLYIKLGRPTMTSFFEMINKSKIRDCPFSLEDAKRFYFISGNDPAAAKGRATRKTPNHVPIEYRVPLPAHILEWHSKNRDLHRYIFPLRAAFLPFHFVKTTVSNCRSDEKSLL